MPTLPSLTGTSGRPSFKSGEGVAVPATRRDEGSRSFLPSEDQAVATAASSDKLMQSADHPASSSKDSHGPPSSRSSHSASVFVAAAPVAATATMVPPLFPSPADKAAATPGIPVARHMAKLEECAKLHRDLHDAHESFRILQQHSEGQQREYEYVLREAQRAQDVLAVVSGEMHGHQERVRSLERENLQLRSELQALRQGKAVFAARSMTMGGGNRVCMAAATHHPVMDAVFPGMPTATGYTLGSTVGASPDEEATAFARRLMTEYAVASFQSSCEPSISILHSLYRNDGRLIAAENAIVDAQLVVLQKLLEEPTSLWRGWAATQLNTLSIRFAYQESGIALLSGMLPALPSLRALEIFGINTTTAVRRLCEVLLSSSILTLSLPELRVGDEALELLWRLLSQRQSLGLVGEADVATELSRCGTATLTVKEKDQKSTEDALRMHTLDLGCCEVLDTMTLRHLCCPGLQVLLLPGCEVMTDTVVHAILRACPTLYTLDISGCTTLTTACTAFFNQLAPQLAVLRVENCPGIRSLHLEYVEVLFSSLANVTALCMPSLKRLPVPISNRSVLMHAFEAPQLEELTCRSMMIDSAVLCPALMVHVPSGRPYQCIAPVSVEELVADEEERSVAVESTAVTSDSADASLPPIAAPPQLLFLAFENCAFEDAPATLGPLLRQQRSLQKLSLHNCQGVRDEVLCGLPPSLLALDLGHTASLTDAGVAEVVLHTPHLKQLSLKGAGAALTNNGIHKLRGLSELQELNLLQLDSFRVTPAAVSAVAASLPQLTMVRHETAVVVSGGASAPGRGGSSLLQVARSDDETDWLAEMAACPRDLLRLRHTAALTLWKERTLPKPSTLTPMATARTAAADAAAAATALCFTPHPPRTTLQTATGGPMSAYNSPAVEEMLPKTVEHDTSCESGIASPYSAPTADGSASQLPGTSIEPHHGRPSSAPQPTASTSSSSSSSDDDDDDKPRAGNARGSSSSPLRFSVEPSAAAVALMASAQLGPWGEEDTLAEHQQEVAVAGTTATGRQNTDSHRALR